MLKILAGEYRSRKLISPDDSESSRPYLNRVKESVFGLLRGWFEGSRVLDLFAGVGTVGLEAASRGAESVLMVEKNPKIHRILEQNVESLGCGGRVKAMLGDALSQTCLLRAPRPVDLVFVDPPFEMMENPAMRKRVLDQISRCREVMGEKGFIVLRSPLGPREADFKIAGFDGPEVHDYGKRMQVLLYAPSQGRAPAQTAG